MVADMDGVTVTRRLREWTTLPILILSVRDRETDKITALDAGASWGDADIDLGPDDLRDAGMAWTDFAVVSDLDDVESMEDVECSRTPRMELP